MHRHLRIFNNPEAWTIPTLCPTGTTSSWESTRHVWRTHQNTNGSLYTSFPRKKVQACMQLLRVQNDRTRWWSSCSTVRAVIWRHTSRTRWARMMNDCYLQWGYVRGKLSLCIRCLIDHAPNLKFTCFTCLHLILKYFKCIYFGHHLNYSIRFDRCNEYCSAQKSRKLTALIRLGGKWHSNFLASKSLKHQNISQYHNPIGCTDCCRGSNDFCMTSVDISMSARCLALEKDLGKSSHSSKPQDMRKQRQRIHEQQIMHYFVQILQANFDLPKSTFQLAVYIMCVSVDICE